MIDPLAVALAALIALVLVGGGLLAGAIWGLTRDREHLMREDDRLHARIDGLAEYASDVRDFVADALRVDEPDDVQPDTGIERGPATVPTTKAIDAAHEVFVEAERGRHHIREEHR